MPSPKWYRVKRPDGTWSRWYRSAALADRSESGQIFQWLDKKGEPSPYGDRPRRRRSVFPVASLGGRPARVKRSWEERARLHESIYSNPLESRNVLARRGLRVIDPVSKNVASLADAAERAIPSQEASVRIHNQTSTFPGTRVHVTDSVQVIHQKDMDPGRDAKVSLLIRVSPQTGKVRGYRIVPMKWGRSVRDDIIDLPAGADRYEVLEAMRKAYQRL